MNIKHILAASLMAATALPTMALPPEGVETWKPAGTGMLRDDLISQYHYIDDYHEFPVVLEESEQVPGRYRMVNAYSNYPKRYAEFPSDIKNYTIIDCSDPEHVFISKGLGAYYIGQDQCITFWSKADDLYFRKYEDWDAVEKEVNCVGKMVDGIVTFPKGQLMVGLYAMTYTPKDYNGEHPEEAPDMVFILANMHGKFRLRLPNAPEPEVKATLEGVDANRTNVAYNVKFGADTEYALAALVEGSYVGGIEKKIASGEVASVRLDSSGTVTFPYTGDGLHTLVVVPFYNGHAHNAEVNARVYEYAANTWRPLCKASYTEGFLHSNELSENPKTGWEFESDTYDVEVEYDEAVYRRFRIKEPYAAYINSCLSTYDYSRNHYIELNAEDPTCVRIPMTENGIGFQLEYLGVINIWSRADRYLVQGKADVAAIKAKGWNGVLADDTFTFGKQSLYINLTDKAPTSWYLANNDGAFKLALPKGTIEAYEKTMAENGVATIATPAFYPERWYTIDGTPLADEPTAHGIYLHLSHGVTKKVIK